jgi:hypothetical protein
MPNIGPLELTIVLAISWLERLPSAGHSVRQAIAGADRDEAGVNGVARSTPAIDQAAARRHERRAWLRLQPSS